MSRRQWLSATWIMGAVTLLATQPVIATTAPQLVVPHYSPARFLAVGSTVSRIPLKSFTAQAERSQSLELSNINLELSNINKELVAATCLSESINSSPRSVAVIKRNQIQQQAILTRNVGRILGQLVPGLSPLTLSNRRAGLFLRGRRVRVLLDGVPLGGSAVVSGIDPNTIDRIEVIRGPNPLCRI